MGLGSDGTETTLKLCPFGSVVAAALPKYRSGKSEFVKKELPHLFCWPRRHYWPGSAARYLEDCDEARVVMSRPTDFSGGVARYALDPGNAARLWTLAEQLTAE
jgi:hypothetical protein